MKSEKTPILECARMLFAESKYNYAKGKQPLKPYAEGEKNLSIVHEVDETKKRNSKLLRQ